MQIQWTHSWERNSIVAVGNWSCKRLQTVIKRHPEEQRCQADKARAASEIRQMKFWKRKRWLNGPIDFISKLFFSLLLFLDLYRMTEERRGSWTEKISKKTGRIVKSVAQHMKLKVTPCSYGNTFTMEWSAHCRINEAEANLPFQYCSSAWLDNNWMG